MSDGKGSPYTDDAEAINAALLDGEYLGDVLGNTVKIEQLDAVTNFNCKVAVGGGQSFGFGLLAAGGFDLPDGGANGNTLTRDIAIEGTVAAGVKPEIEFDTTSPGSGLMWLIRSRGKVDMRNIRLKNPKQTCVWFRGAAGGIVFEDNEILADTMKGRLDLTGFGASFGFGLLVGASPANTGDISGQVNIHRNRIDFEQDASVDRSTIVPATVWDGNAHPTNSAGDTGWPTTGMLIDGAANASIVGNHVRGATARGIEDLDVLGTHVVEDNTVDMVDWGVHAFPSGEEQASNYGVLVGPSFLVSSSLIGEMSVRKNTIKGRGNDQVGVAAIAFSLAGGVVQERKFGALNMTQNTMELGGNFADGVNADPVHTAHLGINFSGHDFGYCGQNKVRGAYRAAIAVGDEPANRLDSNNNALVLTDLQNQTSKDASLVFGSNAFNNTAVGGGLADADINDAGTGNTAQGKGTGQALQLVKETSGLAGGLAPIDPSSPIVLP